MECYVNIRTHLVLFSPMFCTYKKYSLFLVPNSDWNFCFLLVSVAIISYCICAKLSFQYDLNAIQRKLKSLNWWRKKLVSKQQVDSEEYILQEKQRPVWEDVWTVQGETISHQFCCDVPLRFFRKHLLLDDCKMNGHPGLSNTLGGLV